jgi:hypothetical protein
VEWSFISVISTTCVLQHAVVCWVTAGSVAGSQSQQRPAAEDGEEARCRGRGGVEADWQRRAELPLKRQPSRRVLCLSSSLLSVGGGADDLGVESTDPEKTLEEHDFNNFLNCPSFSRKKVN